MKRIIGALIVVLVLGATNLQAKTALEEMNEEVYSPQTSFHYKEVPWSGWNKFWFGSAIVGSVADIASTEYQLGGEDSRCQEANPLFGEDPDLGLLIAGKVVVGGVTWYVIEHIVAPESRDMVRNWSWGILSVLYNGVAIKNMSLDCH